MLLKLGVERSHLFHHVGPDPLFILVVLSLKPLMSNEALALTLKLQEGFLSALFYLFYLYDVHSDNLHLS
jgi:hypothetical protein